MPKSLDEPQARWADLPDQAASLPCGRSLSVVISRRGNRPLPFVEPLVILLDDPTAALMFAKRGHQILNGMTRDSRRGAARLAELTESRHERPGEACTVTLVAELLRGPSRGVMQ